MFRTIFAKARRQEGFTLVELIVVVAILGILTAVVTPRVLTAIDDARDQAAESTAKQIQLSMERFQIRENAYPATTAITTIAELVELLDDYLPVTAATFTTDDPTYLFTAATSDDPPTYSLTVTLANGRQLEITPDDIDVTTP